MKKFNPKERVSIYNEYPRELWPIKTRQVYYFEYYLPTLDNIKIGKLTWYHPSRQIDASCVLTPGYPFYKVKVKNSPFDLCIYADQIAPKTKEGLKLIKKLMNDKWKTEINTQINRIVIEKDKLTKLLKDRPTNLI